MMKSVALLDSTPQDDDFVLISNISDLDDANDGCDDDYLDEHSYDYCEDVLSMSSMHQAITSTSNPLQVVQENFFSESKGCAAPSSTDKNNIVPAEDSEHSNSNILDEVHAPELTIRNHHNNDIVDNDNGAQPLFLMSSLSSAQQQYDQRGIQDSSTSVIEPSSADEVSFHASTDASSSAILSEQDRSEILKAVEENDDILPLASVPPLDNMIDIVEPVIAASDLGGAAASLSGDDLIVPGEPQQSPQQDYPNPALLDDEILPAMTSLTIAPPAIVHTDSNSNNDSKAASSSNEPTTMDRQANKKASKKKRRKQLKIAKKAAAAAAAAAALGGQLATLRSSSTTLSSGSGNNTNPTPTPNRNIKRKGKNKKVANIAVAEAVKSHSEYNKQVAAMNKKR